MDAHVATQRLLVEQILAERRAQAGAARVVNEARRANAARSAGGSAVSIHAVPVVRPFTSAGRGFERDARERPWPRARRQGFGARRQGIAVLAWMLATGCLAVSAAVANPGIMPTPVPSGATPTPGATPIAAQARVP